MRSCLMVVLVLAQACRPSSGHPDAGAPGQPIVAPADQWTWVDFPDSKCGNGSATGLGVNLHPGSTQLLIFMEGGGSCHDEASCWGADPGAVNMSGYGATEFAGFVSGSAHHSLLILDRTRADNPFQDASYVYIPYCTGDLHSGTLLQTLGSTPTYFHGATDLQLFLSRLVPTFAGVQGIWLSGTSAGGYGSYLDHYAVRTAFGVRVDTLDDSGPPLAVGTGALKTLWGIPTPPDCTTCSSPSSLYTYERSADPESRFALLSFQYDSTIAPDLGLTLTQFQQDLDALIAGFDANEKAFIVRNDTSAPEHVVMNNIEAIPAGADADAANAALSAWLTQLVSDDAAWANVDYSGAVP